MDEYIKNFRKRRADRLKERGIRLDEDDDGRWITTENNHHVHISEEGEPDKGNPHVLEKMTSSHKNVIELGAKKLDGEAGKKLKDNVNKGLEKLSKESAEKTKGYENSIKLAHEEYERNAEIYGKGSKEARKSLSKAEKIEKEYERNRIRLSRDRKYPYTTPDGYNVSAKNVYDAIGVEKGMTEDLSEDVDKILDGNRNAIATFKECLNCYPTSWVKKFADYYNGKKFGVERASRGYFSKPENKMVLDADEKQYETCIHELGHMFEEIIPDLHKYAVDFLKEKASGKEIKKGDGLFGTDTRQQYFEGTGLPRYSSVYYKDFSATEIISMGMQNLLGENGTDSWGDGEMKDYKDFMIGVLSTKF